VNENEQKLVLLGEMGLRNAFISLHLKVFKSEKI